MLVTGPWTCSARVKVGGARAVDGWHIGRDEWCDGCGWVARVCISTNADGAGTTDMDCPKGGHSSLGQSHQDV